MTTLMIDFQNLAIRNIFSNKEMIKNPNPDWNLHKHELLQSIFYNIRKFSPTEVILAVDDTNCWRKKLYPLYKAHRKDKKDNDIFPWVKFYEYLYSYVAEIKETFPFYVIQVPYTEADDVIGVLSKHITGDKVVVTGDSDYIQLLTNPSVKLYNPLKEKFVEDDNPNRTMMIKIIAGDVSDNIPNIKPKVGPKTAMKLIINNELETFIKDNNLQENFDRNTKLIDWNYIPDVIKKKIIESWNIYELPSSINIFNFFVRHRLRNQTENISITKQILKPLVDKYVNDDFFEFCEEK
jgi:5'-3' exonuclease